ncbi:hypothetical protein GLOIN_2v1586720 [Rhizophagus irregularis DAOM 181602=DAOM 197198]|nr:hypothetical protein GLOIN_2v1586720 [Rhizophagus irregularis DAOM 181602=DAOM 197198]
MICYSAERLRFFFFSPFHTINRFFTLMVMMKNVFLMNTSIRKYKIMLCKNIVYVIWKMLILREKADLEFEKDYTNGDVIFLKEKFLWDVLGGILQFMKNLDFDTMPSIRLNIMDGGRRIRHDPNLWYLSNKTNSINQATRSTVMLSIRWKHFLTYIAFSRCCSWDNIEISHLDIFAFMNHD